MGGNSWTFLWISWGGWRYILGEWEWMDIFYGWVGVSGDGWKYILGRWE